MREPNDDDVFLFFFFQFHVPYGVVLYTFCTFLSDVCAGIASKGQHIVNDIIIASSIAGINTHKKRNRTIWIWWLHLSCSFFVSPLFRGFGERRHVRNYFYWCIYVPMWRHFVWYTYSFDMANTRCMLWNYFLPNNMCRLARRALLCAVAFHGIRNAVHTPASK